MANKKTVLVTGTNPGGIGNSLAREFHSKGLRVFATARDTAAISDLSDIGVECLSLEITDDASILKLKEEITTRTGGKLDYLINNAGRNYTMPATDLEISEVRAMFEVNVFGVMRMCQVFSPLLMEAQGTIVQIASVAGITPYVFGSSYGASKAALHTYSDTLRLEMAPFGVDVIQIVTGGVKSRIARNTRLLPDTSIYKPIEQDYNRRQQHSQEVGTTNQSYAQRVVRQVLRHRPLHAPRRIWEGNFSWIVWFAHNYLPHSFMTFCKSKAYVESMLFARIEKEISLIPPFLW